MEVGQDVQAGGEVGRSLGAQLGDAGGDAGVLRRRRAPPAVQAEEVVEQGAGGGLAALVEPEAGQGRAEVGAPDAGDAARRRRTSAMTQVEVPAISARWRSISGVAAARRPSTPSAPAWASIRPAATRQPW